MLNSLFVTRGKDLGKSFAVSGSTRSPLTIGRDRSNSIRLRDDEVSRFHCLIEVEDGVTFLVDKDSSNGTFLNGKKVDRSEVVKGDLIRIGNTQLAFDSFLQVCVDPVSAAPQTAAPTRYQSTSFAKTKYINGADVTETNGIGLRLDKDNDSTYQKLAKSKGEVEAGRQYVQLKNDLRFVYRASLATARALDTQRMFHELIELIFDWVEADRGCVLLKSETNGEFKINQTKERGERDEFSRDTNIAGKTQSKAEISSDVFHVSKPVVDYVIAKKVGVLSPTTAPELRTKVAQRSSVSIISEVLCVPIEGRAGDLLGLLYVDRLSEKPAESESRFNMDHLRLMMAMANQAAVALENESHLRALVEKERLSAIGEVTSLMSHRINNILQGLSGGSHLLEAGLEKSDFELCRTGWEITHNNQVQISQLVRDLLVLSKPLDPHRAIGLVAPIVQGTIDELDAELKGHKVTCELVGDDNCEAFVDENYLKTALVNLIRLVVKAEVHGHDGEAPGSVSIELSRLNKLGEEFPGVEISICCDGLPIHTKPQSALDSSEKAFDFGGVNFGGIDLAVTEKFIHAHDGVLIFGRDGHRNQVLIRIPASSA